MFCSQSPLPKKKQNTWLHIKLFIFQARWANMYHYTVCIRVMRYYMFDLQNLNTLYRRGPTMGMCQHTAGKHTLIETHSQ